MTVGIRLVTTDSVTGRQTWSEAAALTSAIDALVHAHGQFFVTTRPSSLLS